MLRMGKHKTLGLAGLLAAMAMVVVASVGAASASAAPNINRCAESAPTEPALYENRVAGRCEGQGGNPKKFIPVKVRGINIGAGLECAKVTLKGTGKWEKNNCTGVEGNKEFVIVQLGKFKFTSTSGTSKLETVGGRVIECTADSNTGEFTGENTAGKVVVTFTGCKGPSGSTCTTSGKASGEIVTKEMSGELVDLEGTEEGAKKVGIYFNKGGTVSPLAEFECLNLGNGSLVKVTGSLICQIKKVNTVTTSFTLTCGQTAGKQAFTHAEGETGTHVLSSQGTAIGIFGESFGPEESAQESIDTITTEEAGEITP